MPAPGECLNQRFRLDEVLGAGGYGQVFRATDLQSGAAVAVKVLLPDGAGYSATRVARFEFEVQALRTLSDPHTVRLETFGTSEGGLLYLVFELVEGHDLDALIAAGGRLDSETTRHILIQVLRSLAEAHGAGILHRDIKPANIRVFRVGADEFFAKLLDFGIAKPFSEGRASVTASAHVVGSVRFSAPEQLFGGRLTAASDLYSLGLVAFEMLTGRPANHLKSLGSNQPVRFEEDDRVDPRLAQIVYRLLERETAARYPNALAVLAELEGRPVAPASVVIAARPAHDDRPTAPPWRLVAIGAAVAVVCAVAVVVVSSRTPDPAPAPVARRVLRTPLTLPVPTPTAPLTVETAAVALDGGTDGGMTPGCNGEVPFVRRGRLSAMKGLSTTKWRTVLPSGYDGREPRPLLVLFHEAGEGPSDFVRYSGFVERADRDGVVIIAPEGDYIGPWGGSLRYVVDTITETTRQLCIDPARIYAVGYGAGGIAIEQLGCEYPVTAMASHGHRDAGLIPRCDPPPVQIPYLHVNASDDGYNPVKGGRGCMGGPRESLADKEQRWRRYQGCAGPQKPYYEQGKSQCVTWTCESPFVSCLAAGGRVWPGSANRVWDVQKCDNGSTDFPLPEVIWQFFSTHGLEISPR